jgi:ferredoxin
MLEDSRSLHSSLLAKVIGARAEFLRAQDEQMFRPSLTAFDRDLTVDVLQPVLASPVLQALQVTEAFLSRLLGPMPPVLLDWSEHVSRLLSVPDEPVVGTDDEPDITEFREDPAPMVDAIRAAKDAVDLPVFVKLSPLGRELPRAAEHAVRAGADAIVAINSFGPCLAIDIETGRPRMGGGNGSGWLSGPALKPLAVQSVFDVARAVDVPVIGCGGIGRGTDVIEMALAGASVVQVCTAAILRGPGVLGRIAAETAAWLAARGYASLDEVRGLAHRLPVADEVAGPPVVDLDLCTGCRLCVGSCGPGAITMADGKAILDGDRCERCGLCLTRCRPGAILWAG